MLKTNKAAAKRFKMTAKGIVKRTRANRRHLLVARSRKRKRQLRRAALVSASEKKTVRRLLPYG
jgi:large subunit ribosomal protein L35